MEAGWHSAQWSRRPTRQLLLLDGTNRNRGTYRLMFDLEKYFKAKGVTTVFPAGVVVFRITDETHYHIPVVVTPYAISTYRGS